MEGHKKLDIIFYGYSDDFITIEVSKFMSGVERTNIVNSILKNYLNFMVEKIDLKIDNIYIYA